MKRLSERGLEEVARRFRVLGDPGRLRLLDHLRRHGEQTVGQLAAVTEHSQAQTSRQLAQLREAGLLRRRQAGNSVYYVIEDPSVFELCDVVCGRLETQAKARVSALYLGGAAASRRGVR